MSNPEPVFSKDRCFVVVNGITYGVCKAVPTSARQTYFFVEARKLKDRVVTPLPEGFGVKSLEGRARNGGSLSFVAYKKGKEKEK